MRKIRKYLCSLLAMLILLAMPVTVKADIGPKPSVVIEFVGMEEQEYYATLLSEKRSTGPWSQGNPYYDYMGEEWVFEEFANYEDVDGYYFLSFMQDCSEDDTFEWTYYPPQRFKVLIYAVEDKQFYCSEEIYERYAFDSYFQVNVSKSHGVTIVTAQKSYDFSLELLSLVVRIVLTIGIELGVAFLFRYKDRKSLKIIGITNIGTQVALNVLLNVINYRSGEMAFVFHYVWMEMVVFAMEAVIYTRLLDKTDAVSGKERHPVLYAALANFVSIVLGIWIAKVVPGIF